MYNQTVTTKIKEQTTINYKIAVDRQIRVRTLSNNSVQSQNAKTDQLSTKT